MFLLLEKHFWRKSVVIFWPNKSFWLRATCVPTYLIYRNTRNLIKRNPFFNQGLTSSTDWSTRPASVKSGKLLQESELLWILFPLVVLVAETISSEISSKEVVLLWWFFWKRRNECSPSWSCSSRYLTFSNRSWTQSFCLKHACSS